MKRPSKFARTLIAAAVSVILIISFIPTAFATSSGVITSAGNLPLYTALHTGNVVLDPSNLGYITESELNGMTGTLNLSGKGITNVEGLQYCTGITTLNLNNNYLDPTVGSADRNVIDSLSGKCTVQYDTQNKITVHFIASMGTAPADVDVYYGQSVTLPGVSGIPAGSSLLGWDANSDGTSDYTVGSTAVVSPALPALSTPPAPVSVTFTAVFKALSVDCTLSALASTQALTPAFSPSTLAYTVSLPLSACCITLTPTAAAGASFTIDGTAMANKTYSLNCGVSATAKIVVTSEDGLHTTTYTVSIARAKLDASRLLSPGISTGVLNPVFDPYKANYTLTLPEGTPSVTFTPVKSLASDKLFINGEHHTCYTVTLKNGQSKMVYIRIMTPGKVQRIYNFKVVRANSTNADLKLLNINTAAGLIPAFSAGTLAYTTTVPENRNSIAVMAKPADKNATVTINGVRCPDRIIRINNSQSKTVTIVVRAQAGNTKTYTITLVQPPQIKYFTAWSHCVKPGTRPIQFSYSLEGASDNTVMEIYSGGAWQKLMSRSETCGHKNYLWDGKVGGVPITPGSYQVRLSASWNGLAATPRIIKIEVK